MVDGDVNSSLLIPTIHKTLSACKRSHPKKRDKSTFPTNPWYNEECKATMGYLKERKTNKENKNKYEKLVQLKKRNM